METKARITVIMPCYNAEKYIAEAIESILMQTYQKFKLLVIDDGSTDKSRQIIEKYAKIDTRVCYLYNVENKGQIYIRNKAIEESDTEFIAYMDADDVASKYRFEREVAFLDKNPKIGAVGGKYYRISEDGKILGKSKIRAYTDKSVKAHLFFHNVLANGSMMFRTQTVRESGIRYLEKYREPAIEDYCFWSMLSEHIRIANLPCILLKYRVVENGMSRETRKKRSVVRNQAFDKIHIEMFERNGFILGANSSEFLKMFRDEICCTSLKDLKIACQCLMSIGRQSSLLKKPYKWELRWVSFYFMAYMTMKFFWQKLFLKGKNK